MHPLQPPCLGGSTSAPLWAESCRQMNALPSAPGTSVPLKRKALTTNVLQTTEISPSLSVFSYLLGSFSAVIFRLPRGTGILSTSNSSPKQFSNVSSLIPGPLEKLCSAPSLRLGRQRLCCRGPLPKADWSGELSPGPGNHVHCCDRFLGPEDCVERDGSQR